MNFDDFNRILGQKYEAKLTTNDLCYQLVNHYKDASNRVNINSTIDYLILSAERNLFQIINLENMT